MGATSFPKPFLSRFKFQSTHPYWVRPRLYNSCELRNEFQSTHPYWVRPTFFCSALLMLHVSIHAPVLGATVVKLMSCAQLVFQSTHPYWVRPLCHIVYWTQTGFQSTHPYWVRRHNQISYHMTNCFNPRTRIGCDCHKYIKLHSMKLTQAYCEPQTQAWSLLVFSFAGNFKNLHCIEIIMVRTYQQLMGL